MHRFLDLADFSRDQVQDLVGLARRLQEHPEPHALAGRILGLLFMNPSLRTLSSFQAAMIRLGGGAFVTSPEMSIHGLEARSGIVMDGAAAEHVREAVPVIASYGDAMGVRAFAERRDLAHDLADTDFKNLTSLIDKPWINMESAIDHPCQSLADWKTLDELGVPENGKFVLSWGYHPRALPLAVSAATIHMAAKRGMNVVHLRPAGFELPPAVMDKERKAAVSYRFIENWSAGVELVNELEYNSFNFTHLSNSGYYLGPTIHFGGERFFFTATALWQMPWATVHTDTVPGSLVNHLVLDNDFERFRFRLKAGYTF